MGLYKAWSSVLAWQSRFRTFEWMGELADPVTIINQTRQLLALV